MPLLKDRIERQESRWQARLKDCEGNICLINYRMLTDEIIVTITNAHQLNSSNIVKKRDNGELL